MGIWELIMITLIPPLTIVFFGLRADLRSRDRARRMARLRAWIATRQYHGPDYVGRRLGVWKDSDSHGYGVSK